MFLQNSGPSLPDSSMWHHITVASTLNKYRYADVRVHVFPTVLLELKVCYVDSFFVFVHYSVIFEKIFSMKIFLMHTGRQRLRGPCWNVKFLHCQPRLRLIHFILVYFIMHLLSLRGQDLQLRSVVLKSLGELLVMLVINLSLLVLP